MEVESKPDANESENLSYFGFAKNCGNLTTFGFELCHIPSLDVTRQLSVLVYQVLFVVLCAFCFCSLGVIFLGNEAVPGAVDVVRNLKKMV